MVLSFGCHILYWVYTKNFKRIPSVTLLLFPPRILIRIRGNYFKRKAVSVHIHSFDIRLADGSNHGFSLDALYKKLYCH